MACGEIEVKKEMILFQQEAILAAPIFVEDKTDQDIIECGLNINDVEVISYENKVTLDPGPEKAVPLQPAYPVSGKIKGCNSIEEDSQSGCENEISSNNKTGNLRLQDIVDEVKKLRFAYSNFSGQVYNVSEYGGAVDI